MEGNGKGLKWQFHLTGHNAILADTGNGFFALIAGDGWPSFMEQGNIFSAGTVIISLLAVSKKVVPIVL